MTFLIVILSLGIAGTLVTGQTTTINIPASMSIASGRPIFTVGSTPIEVSTTDLSIYSQLVNYLAAGVKPNSYVPVNATLEWKDVGPLITFKVGRFADRTVGATLNSMIAAYNSVVRVQEAVSSLLLHNMMPKPSLA